MVVWLNKVADINKMENLVATDRGLREQEMVLLTYKKSSTIYETCRCLESLASS